MQAVRDRLRPILMTSLAFSLGVLPLALATGAGSGAQRAIGTGVLGGMIVGTVLGIFFVPLFFVVVERVFVQRKDRAVTPCRSCAPDLRPEGIPMTRSSMAALAIAIELFGAGCAMLEPRAAGCPAGDPGDWPLPPTTHGRARGRIGRRHRAQPRPTSAGAISSSTEPRGADRARARRTTATCAWPCSTSRGPARCTASSAPNVFPRSVRMPR